ncbi:MAG TPA: tetratricopeptide repeat protein [Ktedonobacteraceae bacterium]|nr:tetratricopeptide repeat protein [Ktedonobacteraceae bacterium]
MRYVPIPCLAIPGTQRVAPALVSCALFIASFLPWLRDPLGGVYSAWQLPLFPGRGVAGLSYGWLCLGCAACILLIAWTDWRPFNGRGFLSRLLCLVPGALFLLSGLDASLLALVTRHELQFLWIQQHFGYQATTQLFPFSPSTLQNSPFIGRLQLLLNQGAVGPPVLCVCAGLLPAHHPSRTTRSIMSLRWLHLFCGGGMCGLLALLMCVPVGMCCEYAAKEELASGNYSEALSLLDAARAFSPDFEQVALYHSERGKAQYFLTPAQPTPDSQVYLATVYREQGDYLEAYQQLLGVWRSLPTAPWVLDEMDVTLEDLTESLRPLRGISTKRVASDDAALPWLQILTRVDASNVYGLYMTGRIQYDLHNYTACLNSMSLVIQHSTDAAVQSSAYTYSGLCENGLGQYAVARQLLFKAVALDPNYHNNTAREELSGLH